MSSKINDATQRFALDVGVSSQDLRAKFQKDPKAGLQAAAQQFESMFLQMVLKSMRDATPQDGLMDSESTRFYTSMLDQQMAQNLTGTGKGLGFAKLIEEQLGRQMLPPQGKDGTATPEAAENAASGLPLAASSSRHLPAMNRVTLLQSAAVPQGVTASSAGVAETGGSNKDFVNRVWPHAVEASRSTGIPPQFLVGHAALESGWGKNEILKADGRSSFNLFGIKAGKNWTGATVDAQTTEYVDGEPQRVTEKFRAYGSYAEAFRDYASVLRNNTRYGGVIGSQDGTEFARRLQQAGYATDPMYADKLARIINGPTLRQALIG
jgi:flagellar protein FlgJ